MRLAAGTSEEMHPTYRSGLTVHDDGLLRVRITEIWLDEEAEESALAISVRLTPREATDPKKLGAVHIRGPSGNEIPQDHTTRSEPRLHRRLLPADTPGTYVLEVEAPPLRLKLDIYRPIQETE